jgi:hypothetical protein
MAYRIFVESHNDRMFVQAVAQNIGISMNDDSFYPKNIGETPTNITTFIKDNLSEIQTGKIDKIGIIIDLDEVTIAERLNFVNKGVNDAFEGTPILSFTAENQLQSIDIQENKIEIVCYFMKVGSRGHLDTVLKEIACKSSDYADCLIEYRKCIEAKKLKYTQSDFEKYWVDQYIRQDTCTKKEQGQRENKCSMKVFNVVLQKGVFNLEHECLDNLKTFLKLFD